MYRKADIQLILYIKHLLHNEKFTIQGARKHIETESSSAKAAEKTPEKTAEPVAVNVNSIRLELIEILNLLD